MALDLTFLGTGTSGGVPEIGCRCPVCTSNDPKDRRLRTSGLVTRRGRNLLIDSGTDLRAQFLREGIDDIDGVLYTHVHADHCLGLDDLRRISLDRGKAIPLHIHPAHLEILKNTFRYMFVPPKQMGGGIVQVDPRPLTWHEAWDWDGLTVEPLPIRHGILDITGWLFGRTLAWVTDASEIPDSSMERLSCGLDVLVLNALRHTPHRTHFNLEQAIAAAKRIGAKETYFVHMTHDISHGAVDRDLPPGMHLAWDGLHLSL